MIIVNPGGRVFEVIDQEELAELLAKPGFRAATEEEEAGWREEHAARHAAPESPDAESVYYRTVTQTPDGYGMSQAIIREELKKLGVNLVPAYAGQKVGLLYSYPYEIGQIQSDVRILMTMFESDKIPDEWPELLHQADRVIVPSRWCQIVFAKAGVDTTVVPLGYDSRAFTYIERPVPVEEKKDFVFIHYDSFNVRKGFLEVFTAFTEEFKKNEPVKLILKTVKDSPGVPILPSEYPNIEVVTGALPVKDLASLLGRANCMVYPSRGEGFGITPLEAMATGLPAIVPNAHGISQYFNPLYMLEAEVEGTCPGLYQRFKGQDVGKMVICSVEDLRRKMRYAYNHQAEMKALGRKACNYVQQWTYAKTALALRDIITESQRLPHMPREEQVNLKAEEV